MKDFSDLPGLGDQQGLQDYLSNQSLAAAGLTPAPKADGQAAASAAQPDAQAAIAQPNIQQQQQQQQGWQAQAQTPLTQEQLAQITNYVMNVQRQQQVQQTQQAQHQPMYTAKETAFVTEALRQGYSLDQINKVINERRGQANGGHDPRVDQIVQYLQSQEYAKERDAFVTKASAFQEKWGLTDGDLELFANKALQAGINIAQANTDLETVFRAIFPEQYALRSQRMQSTPSSQIYGGASAAPMMSGQQAEAQANAYVEAFLHGAMPNSYNPPK